jgi:heme o synthase
MNKKISLIKPLLSAAIAFSACIGFSLSYHSAFSIQHSAFLFIGVFLLSAGASAINQYIERDIDKLMNRTSSRPIPSGNISPNHAIVFAFILCLSGAIILSFLSLISMLLGLMNIILYDLIYTPLKYKSHLALLPGGLVGAVPPLIGWFAAGEINLSLSIICFSSFMFLWQIPHFIIINMKYSDDYKLAGIPSIAMSISNKSIKLILFIWLISASLTTLLFPFADIISSLPQLLFLIILNASVIIFFSFITINKHQFLINKANIFIHLYLFLLFLLIIADRF